MRPCIRAPEEARPLEAGPQESIHFNFSAFEETMVVAWIQVEGQSRRPYSLTLSEEHPTLGMVNGFFVPYLKKIRGYRVPVDGYTPALVWNRDLRARVTFRNQGKSPCRVSCLLKGWIR